MSPQVARIIDHWARAAILQAVYEQLSDGCWYGRVPRCPGAIATAATEQDAEQELLSVLKDWALLGVQLGDDIPVFGDTDLNTEEIRRLAS